MNMRPEDDGRITNVKISVIFLSKVKIEEFKTKILTLFDKKVSYKKNIIIIHVKYTCIIFHKGPGKYHVNITKIKTHPFCFSVLKNCMVGMVTYIRCQTYISVNVSLY